MATVDFARLPDGNILTLSNDKCGMPFNVVSAPTMQDVRSPIERTLEWSAALPATRALGWLIAFWTMTIIIDAATGRMVSINAIYLLPLCLTAWCFGRNWGFLAGIAAVAVTLGINGFGDGLSAQASNVPAVIAIWNAAMRITAVIFLILLVSAFRRTFDRERLHARVDPLTGLGNRRAFAIESQKLAMAAKRDDRTLLCGLIDIDDFKMVNDTHGHAAGDQVLQTAAHALSAAVRTYDAIARVGGDELAFCLLVRDTRSAERKAASIYEHVALALAKAIVPSSCSLGATANLSLAKALAHADQAMYAAKENGKGTWQFLTEHEEVPERLPSNAIGKV